MKLSDIILAEATAKPKVVVMAGGAGTGKSYLLDLLDLDSLHLVNPDKYVEDPNHPAYNKLSPGVAAANKEAEELSNKGESFVWDTTASNPKKIKELLNKGYDVYMVMVYSHPMIAYISNALRTRQVPSSAVFSTWRNVYDIVEDYNKMLGGQLSIFVNDRGGKYKKEVEAFNTAAKNGEKGISDYLQKYNEKNNIGGSSFRDPYEMNDEEEQEFAKATANIDYDRSNYSEDRGMRKYFGDWYRKKGIAPGEDRLEKALASIRRRKENDAKRAKQVLADIAEMIFNPTFQESLVHSSPAEIDKRVQEFLR